MSGFRRSSSRSDDFCRRDQLTGVTRGVLGRMEQEAEDVRRQLGSTNAAVVEQLVACHMPQLIQRAVNVGAGVINKISQACGRLARLSFGPERSLLRVAQRFAARVREEAIERGAEMSHVKSNRRGAAGPGPDLIRRHLRNDLLEFIARLHECVCDGHQHRIDACDRSAHPGFRLSRGGHSGEYARACRLHAIG